MTRLQKRVEDHAAEIRRIVAEGGAENPRLFGSVVRGDDHDASDVDILVDAKPGTSLMDLARIENRISDLIGADVDVVTPGFLHPEVRDRVVRQARTL